MWTGCVWRVGSSSVLRSVSLLCIACLVALVFLFGRLGVQCACLLFVMRRRFDANSHFQLPFYPSYWNLSTLLPSLSHKIQYSPILYSIAGLRIDIVNDFKSIEGDRELGLQSLPVAFGVDGAKYICAGSVTLTQLGVAAYLQSIGETTYAAILLGLLLPQIYFQATLLLPDPVANDVKYQASSQPFFVFGILATALCLGHHDFSA